MWLAVALLQISSSECGSMLERAQLNYNAKNYPRAVSEFETALRFCESSPQLLLALGQAQLLDQQFEAAVRTFAKVPQNVLAKKLSGDALYLMGKDHEAEEMLKSALEIEPNHEPTLYALGRIYYQLNRFPEAVTQFQKVIEADPKSYRAYDNLGLCYDALQQDTLAIRHFLKALELVNKDHPEYDWAHANFADFFLKRNQHENAFQLAAEAAKRNPTSARNFFLTGKALVSLGKDDLSLRWLEQSVKLDPTYATAHYLLAQTYRRTGQEEKAKQHFEIFKKVNTNARARR